MFLLKRNLRKNTSINRVYRRALEDYDFGENFFAIKKGQSMAISIYNLHHDESIWREPDKFKPERFENNEIPKNQLVFLPFLDGPRNCIGISYFFSIESVNA